MPTISKLTQRRSEFSPMVKSTVAFLSNVLAFMFMRHTFREHIFLLTLILFISFICSVVLAVLIATNLITPRTEPWPAIAWAFDLLMSFINIQKITYIGITYFIALVVNHLAAELVAYQSRRTQTTTESLVDELRCNTRAVIITLSNALSLTCKIFIGISLIFAVSIYCGWYKDGKGLEFVLYEGAIFIFFDCVLFMVQRFLLPFNGKNNSGSTSQTSGTA